MILGRIYFNTEEKEDGMYDEAKIESYYEKLQEGSYVKDGINNLEEYKEANPKILWVLKEAHSQTPNESWDHRGFHSEALLDYPDWKKTYSRIVRISYALLNGIENIDDVLPIGKFSKEEVLKTMRKIAFINVKKSSGGSNSSGKEITEHYNKHKTILHEQINEINPDIIINGSRKWEIIGSESIPNAECIGVNKFEAYYNKKRIGIHAYHPMAFYSNYENEVLELISKSKKGQAIL